MSRVETMAGEVQRAGDTYVATPFLLFLGVPLLPTGPARVCRGDDARSCGAAPSTGATALSLVRAYAWVWLVLAWVLLALAPRLGLALAVGGALVFGAVFRLARRAGRLDARGVSLRQRHARALGFAADPGELGPGPWEARLVERVQRHATALAQGSYRESPPTWDVVALDPLVTDETFLVAACALARRLTVPGALPVETQTEPCTLASALQRRLDALPEAS